MSQRLIGYILICASFFLVVGVLYWNGTRREVPLLFSPTQVLGSTWNHYKLEYLEPGTHRTLDKQRNFITTSEGESYTMLRAVWMGDKETFDSSWQWTKDNLQHKSGDHLMSWLFGQRADGSYGVLTNQGGANSASDADSDSALALVFAYARWQDTTYLGDARLVIRDLWDKEVMTINGTPYLVANNIEKTSTQNTALVNVSYFSPYAYRIFAAIDPSHPWQQLVSSSYTTIERSLQASLGTSTSGLPPDWMRVNKQTGALTADSSLPPDFSFDALRTPWRLALDYDWYKDDRAKNILAEMNYLSTMWQENKSLGSRYSHGGAVLDGTESAAMYGGTIGYFTTVSPNEAKDVYMTKLQYLFSPDTNSWKQTLSYYDDNWAWFGIGLYNHILPNLFTSLPLELYQL